MCIKKSCIHRIIPYFKDIDLNINIWHKNVNQYLSLRENCDIHYKELNKIIYNSENNFNIINKVFYLGFNEINELIEDTKISFDDNKNNFFDDNVPRFIDHDKLHILVAKK